MKHDVFILGGQRIDQKSKKGRRERIEKGSREGIEQFEVEGLRDPPLLEFLDPTPSCSHCFFKSSGYNKLELKAYSKHYLKNMSWCETECKKMCHW